MVRSGWPHGRNVAWRCASWSIPAVTAGALAALALSAGWRGSDIAAHAFRVGLVRQEGFRTWNNYWFGGHHTPGYGILTPTIGAAVGLGVLAVVCAVVSAALADSLITRALGHRNWWASMWFAAGTVTNVVVGRVPFALGMTIGLAALVAAQRRRVALAMTLAVATAAASAVVSVFLGLIFAAWAITGDQGHRRRSLALAAVSTVPVLVIAVLYPQGGTFPFRFATLMWTLAVCAVVVALVPVGHRLVRNVAALYALAAIVVFVVPSPLGANVTRLGMYAAGPVLLALVPLRSLGAAATLPLVWWWQWSPAVDAIASSSEPSTQPAFYEPLIEFLDGAEVDATNRIEVVPTRHHWESAFVALEVPIARGWERQLDRRFNSVFYEPELTADMYEDWLRDSGVRLVALPNAPLDPSAEDEAALLATDVPFLEHVWESDDWQVWEVVDATGMIEGSGEVVDVGVDHVTVEVEEPGDLVVRVRSSDYWHTDPPSCVRPTDEGWTELVDVDAGVVELRRDEAGLLAATDLCALEE
jgi:hypothetical protein